MADSDPLTPLFSSSCLPPSTPHNQPDASLLCITFHFSPVQSSQPVSKCSVSILSFTATRSLLSSSWPVWYSSGTTPWGCTGRHPARESLVLLGKYDVLEGEEQWVTDGWVGDGRWGTRREWLSKRMKKITHYVRSSVTRISPMLDGRTRTHGPLTCLKSGWREKSGFLMSTREVLLWFVATAGYRNI